MIASYHAFFLKRPSDAAVKVVAARNTGAHGARLDFDATDRVQIAPGPGSMWSGLYQAHGEVFATYGRSGTSYVVGPLLRNNTDEAGK